MFRQLLSEMRRAHPIRSETDIAPAAAPALRRQPAIAGMHEVGQYSAVTVAHDRAFGHPNQLIGTVAAMPFAPQAVASVRSAPEREVAERQQRCHVAVGHHPYIAAVPAVAAIGAAARHVRLATEGHAARPAVTALRVQLALVDKVAHQRPRRRLQVSG